MADVLFLRHGRGRGRLARRHGDVDLRVLETRTRSRTLWFVSDIDVPEFGQVQAALDEPAKYVVVHVAPDKTFERFDRAGYWLFRSLRPREFEDLMETDALAEACE